MNDSNVINKTGRAVLAIVVLVFCVGNITWLEAYGDAHNSLHQSAMSWSFTVLLVAMAALGLASAVQNIVPLLTARPPQT